MLYHKNISKGQQSTCLIILSLFWGLLAFTQKSLASINTDCIRYYYDFEYFEQINPFEVFSVFDFSALLNFVFHPISAFTVALTGNVQSMSLLWTFIVYFLTFLSAKRLMKYYDCYTNRNFANLVLCLTFCFVAFVQVSELLKQASAFAIFFYGFTMFMTGSSKVIVMLFIIVAVGLHPSSLMLLPLFFYNWVKTWILLVLAIVAIVVSQFVDIIGLFMSLLPGGNYAEMIMTRFGGSSSEGGTFHYITLQLLMLCPTIFLWLTGKIKEKKQQYAVNVVLLYFLVTSLNFDNLIAYLRFAIFAHWLFVLVYILCLKNIYFKEVKHILNIMILCMFLMTVRWTKGRTTPGGYASSYMDNSLVNIVFATSYDYLKVDYTK
ncbi:MAG: EpsG family protein [Bacteroides sp.]|nr:EpsG family protein [Bacteroides sp.]